MNDLKTEVIGLLSEADDALGKRFIRKFRLVIGQSTEEQQMQALASFWSIELGMLPGSNIDAREYLMPDVDAKTWLARFKKHILPIVLANKLPK
jgi:hypothetical protein